MRTPGVWPGADRVKPQQHALLAEPEPRGAAAAPGAGIPLRAGRWNSGKAEREAGGNARAARTGAPQDGAWARVCRRLCPGWARGRPGIGTR